MSFRVVSLTGLMKGTMSKTSFFKKFRKPLAVSASIVFLLSSIGLGTQVYLNTSPTLTLTNENSVTLGEVNGASVDHVIQEITKHKDDKEFFIFIRSPGGSVDAGNRLINVMKDKKNLTCVVNFAASMAFSILQQGCNKRLVTENAILMQHHVSVGGYFTIKDLREILPLIEAMEDGLNKGDAARMGLTIEEFRKKLGNEWWIKGAAEALRENAADAVVKVLVQMDLTKEQLADAPVSN